MSEGTLRTFALVNRSYEADSHAESADPGITRASANVVAALDTFPPLRVKVTKEMVNEACADAVFGSPGSDLSNHSLERRYPYLSRAVVVGTSHMEPFHRKEVSRP